MSDAKHRPWWAEHFPDVRGWATIGIFALVAYDMSLIAFVPGLGDNELFKTLTTLLLGSGAFGLVCSFLWGGSKATASAVETVNAMARTPNAQPAGSTVVTATAPSSTTVTTQTGEGQ
jgi:hypothetical protein